MSSVSSAEPTAQQNFNPSWMRSAATNNARGGFSSSGVRAALGAGAVFDEGGDDHSGALAAAAAASILSAPIESEFSYTRERLLELAPTGSIMPDALRDQLFFNETSLPLVSNTPLSELEQKLQSNINSSKAMSLLSQSDRHAIANGAAYGSGYGGGSSASALQNGGAGGGQAPSSRWAPKSSWTKTTPDRSLGARGGGGNNSSATTTTRTIGSIFGRGGGRIGGGSDNNGFGGGSAGAGNGSAEEGAGGGYQPKFSALRRGGVAVGRGGSTAVTSFNTRADALYNPNDPTDRPKAVAPAATRSESDDDEEEGWSKVGSSSRHTSTTTPASAERPPWARSESWIQRTEAARLQQQQAQQQQQQASATASAQQQQPPISHWNQPADAWKDRNQMVAATVKKTSTTETPPATTTSEGSERSEHPENLQMPSYAPSSATWGGSGGIFYQAPMLPVAPAAAPPPPPPKDVDFYYMDPTETRRGPFSQVQMTTWFKAGYFTDESLRVQRGENGEYKTIGELKKVNGAATPFDYPEDAEQPRAPAPQIPQIPQIPGTFPGAPNPLYPGAWTPQTADVYSMMQSTFEQQMMMERTRLMEEHQRRVAEEAKKLAEFQEAMYRQMMTQQEQSQLQLREQELALQRHREELERRDMELKKEAMLRQQQIEQEARELAERKAALEAEDRRTKQMAELKLRAEEQQREAADRARRAEEAAEKERIRLESEARQAEEMIRQLKIKKEQEERARKLEQQRLDDLERARLQVESDAIWAEVRKNAATTVSAAPKQVSPSGSDDSEGWVTKEVKHTKAAPWAAKVAEAPAKSEKTLLEIQLEEERKLKAERELKKAQVVKEAPIQKEEKSSWGGAKTWAAPDVSAKSYVSPFLDGPSLEAANKQLQKKNSQPKMVVPAAAKPTTPVKKAVPPASKTTPISSSQKKKSKEEAAAEEFEAWFLKRFQQLKSADIDAPTLFSCIVMLDNPNEVEDIVMSYLEESKTVKEFVREFIKRRIAMRAAGGRPDVDDLTSARTASAAPSDSNSGSNSNSGAGQGKKKKKNTKQVLDGNILGFRGAAASDRLNKGEIDAVPSTPVNPSRR